MTARSRLIPAGFAAGGAQEIGDVRGADADVADDREDAIDLQPEVG
jgi:hypothetical protein